MSEDRSLAPRSLAAAVGQFDKTKTSKMFGKDELRDPTNPFHLIRRRRKVHDIMERIEDTINKIQSADDAQAQMVLAQAANLKGLVGLIESQLLIADSLSVDSEEETKDGKTIFSRITLGQLVDDMVNGYEIVSEKGETAEVPGVPVLIARMEHALGANTAMSSVTMQMVNDFGKHYEVFYSAAHGRGRRPDPHKYDKIIAGEIQDDEDDMPSRDVKRKARGITMEEVQAAQKAGSSGANIGGKTQG